MEHTKLKVGEIANGFREIVDEETGGRLFYETVQTLDRAKRIVKCRNGWDGLVDYINYVDDEISYGEVPLTMIQWKQALAAAEEAKP